MKLCTIGELPIDKVDFVVVDLETTGFSSDNDSVVEVAGVKIKNGKISEKFQSLIYAEYIPFYATRVHGIDNDMVRDAPELELVRGKFCKFTQNCVFVGHNIVAFDKPFLCENFNIDTNTLFVDTLKISRQIFSSCRGHKLPLVAERLGIKNNGYHRALNDAMVTAKVFLKMVDLHPQKFRFLKDVVA